MPTSLIKITGLPENEIQAILSVFKKYPELESAILYGLRAKGNFRAGSDIDLTLFGPQLDLSKQFAIEND